MPLTPGTRLGPYEILEPIGAGGMGEVYRALDTKLGRDVAVKVLPEEFARDKERVDRFEREARLLAQLNHANIATLHGLEEHDGQKFLVMELVEGETLAELIAQGPIPVDEAIPLFVRIAEGLEAAHEKGIIHRDLKPANIKIGPDGNPKILDFGLAKAFVGDTESASDSSQSPTLTKGTALGAIMGTAAYMSPEQARAKPVDSRTDIWAMGVCLFEGLSGKKPFDGDTVTDVLAAVVKNEPRWEALPADVPSGVRRLLERSLAKTARDRIHHAADARIEMESALGESAVHVESRRSSGTLIIVSSIAVLCAALAAWSLTRPAVSPSHEITRFLIQPADGVDLAMRSFGGSGATFNSTVAISPDGRHVAYAGIQRQPGKVQLYLRSMDTLTSRVVEGSDGAAMPFFSPDSQWLGFWAPGKLMKVAISGGAPVPLADMQSARGASWGPDGTIVFTPALNSGLWRVSADGGETEVLTVLDRERREKAHRHPEILPGGDAVLFTIGTGDITSWDEASIALLSLETGERRVLIEGGTFARYVASGHLVYGRAGNLLAVPFDLDELEVQGSPVPVLEGIHMTSGAGNTEFGVSRGGTLLYARGVSESDAFVELVDRNGDRRTLVDAPRAYVAAKPSPDGRLLAIWVEEANGTIFIHDIERGTTTRLASGFDNHAPVWSPDGRRIAFRSNRDGQFNLYRQPVDGSGDAERLTESKNQQNPFSWSPDGTMLAFMEFSPETGFDLWVLPADGTGAPELFLQSNHNEAEPAFSPDGRFIAYRSDESGRDEVYLCRFPDCGRKWQVSVDGGVGPRWNPRGGELFYQTGDKVIAVDVVTEGELTLGTPRVLFEASPSFYSVMPSGNEFVFVAYGLASPVRPELVLVENWFDELERLVPSN